MVEFSPFVHEVSSLAYCQEEHIGIWDYLCGKCYGFYNNFKWSRIVVL